MTELSDYRRLVSDPEEKRLWGIIREQRHQLAKRSWDFGQGLALGVFSTLIVGLGIAWAIRNII